MVSELNMNSVYGTFNTADSYGREALREKEEKKSILEVKKKKKKRKEKK